jgi:hypothetical protein
MIPGIMGRAPSVARPFSIHQEISRSASRCDNDEDSDVILITNRDVSV